MHSSEEAGSSNSARKYSRDGTLLGSYLRRSTFPADWKPGDPFEPNEVMSSGNEVVLHAYGDLIQLDGAGRGLGRMHLGDGFRDFAITADHRIYGCGLKAGFQRFAGPVRPSVRHLERDEIPGALFEFPRLR